MSMCAFRDQENMFLLLEMFLLHHQGGGLQWQCVLFETKKIYLILTMVFVILPGS